jgi:hypothetical protein
VPSNIYEPKFGGRESVAGLQPMGTAVHLEPKYFGDLTPYLTYGPSYYQLDSFDGSVASFLQKVGFQISSPLG